MVQKRDGGGINACRERSTSVTGQHQALLDVRREGREVERVSWMGVYSESESERLRVRGRDARLYRVSVVPYKDNGVCLESRLYSVFRREHRKTWTR